MVESNGSCGSTFVPNDSIFLVMVVVGKSPKSDVVFLDPSKNNMAMSTTSLEGLAPLYIYLAGISGLKRVYIEYR